MYEKLKNQWDMGYITEGTLQKWVLVNDKRPGSGITREEYKEITGHEFE